MLGDCYAAAVVEQLSKKELMALDAAALYQDTPVTSNGHIGSNDQTSEHCEPHVTDMVVVEMGNAGNIANGSIKK